MREHLATSLLVLSAVAVGQSVDVHPHRHSHTFYGGGCATTLYPNHILSGTPSGDRAMVFDWLFRDLENVYVRLSFNDNSEPTNDNDDPFDLNLSGFSFGNVGESAFAQEAFARNPRTKLHVYAEDIPLWLRRTDANGDQFLDTDNPDLYAEIAEWLFANLVDMKLNKRLDIDAVDLLNEPDLGSATFKHSRDDAKRLFANVPPLLEQMIAAQGFRYGVAEMPRFAGPSCLTPRGARNWSDEIRTTAPAAWANIDIVTTHQYSGNSYDETWYRDINGFKGDRDFVVNEMHTQHRSVLNDPDFLPEDFIDDEIEVALIFGRLFSISVNNGANGWAYFLSNSPNPGATSLLFSPWGRTPTRRKVYYGYRQLTSLQPAESDVVQTDGEMLPAGWHTVGYHKWGDNRVFLTVVAASDVTTPVEVNLFDNAGSRLMITRVIDRVTTATRDLDELDDTTFSVPVDRLRIGVTRHSLRTLEIHTAPTVSPQGEVLNDVVWLRSGDNGRYVSGFEFENDLIKAESSDGTVAEAFHVIRAADGASVNLISARSGRYVRADFSSAGVPLRVDGDEDSAFTRFAWNDLAGPREFELQSRFNFGLVGVENGPTGDALFANRGVSTIATRLEFGRAQQDVPASFAAGRSLGCLGSAGVPLTRAARGSVPAVGHSFDTEFHNLPPSTAGLALIGFVEFPFIDLGPLGALSCFIGMRPLVTSPMVSTPAGVASYSLPIPDQVALLGGQLFVQGLIIDPAANSAGLTVSDKALVLIGR